MWSSLLFLLPIIVPLVTADCQPPVYTGQWHCVQLSLLFWLVIYMIYMIHMIYMMVKIITVINTSQLGSTLSCLSWLWPYADHWHCADVKIKTIRMLGGWKYFGSDQFITFFMAFTEWDSGCLAPEHFSWLRSICTDHRRSSSSQWDSGCLVGDNILAETVANSSANCAHLCHLIQGRFYHQHNNYRKFSFTPTSVLSMVNSFLRAKRLTIEI